MFKDREHCTSGKYSVAEHRLPVDTLLHRQDEVNLWGTHAGHSVGTLLLIGRRIYERS